MALLRKRSPPEITLLFKPPPEEVPDVDPELVPDVDPEEVPDVDPELVPEEVP